MRSSTSAFKLLPLLVLTACGGSDPKSGTPVAAPPAPEVNVVMAAPAAATITQDLPGRLQAVRTAQVRARVEGVIEKRLFEEGSEVKSGASLYQIDARTYRANVEAARAEAAATRLTAERYKSLREVDAVSQQELDLALAKQKQAEAVLAKAELDLENAHVPAPISGRIGRSQVTEGALVGRNEVTPLATIEQLDPIYVNFTQSSSELFQLRKAMEGGKLRKADQAKVELVLEDGSIYGRAGKVTFSDQAVDPNTGAVMLRAEFPNPNRELLPGGFVRIRFPQAQADGAIRVPQRAVLTGPQGQYVLTVDAQGKIAPQPVKTGAMSGDQWLIVDGLKGGEQVTVDGLQKAKPGVTVKPVLLSVGVNAAAANAKQEK